MNEWRQANMNGFRRGRVTFRQLERRGGAAGIIEAICSAR